MKTRYFLIPENKQIVRIIDTKGNFCEFKGIRSLEKFEACPLSDTAENRIKVHTKSGWWQEILLEEAALMV